MKLILSIYLVFAVMQASGAVLLDEHYSSGTGNWFATVGGVSQSASEGCDFVNGSLRVTNSVTMTNGFAPVTNGAVAFSFWHYVAETNLASANNGAFFVYMLPDATVNSANSAGVVNLSREGASSGLVVSYRTGGSFTGITPTLQRGVWNKIGMVVNITNRTYDVYLNDILWVRNIASPNTTFTKVDRIAVISTIESTNSFLDNVYVERDWALSESVLTDHDFTVGQTGSISNATPTTDTRNINPQPWSVAQNSAAAGGFTLGANGAAPDLAKTNLAMVRCVAQGIAEAEFQSSATGVVHFGLADRVWSSLMDGGGVGLIMQGGSTNKLSLIIPDSSSAMGTVTNISFTPSANTVYSLKLETRGRFYIASYKAASMDSGVYTQAFVWQVTGSTTGGRGVLSEENAGIYIDTTQGAADNYGRRFRFTGAIPPGELNLTNGPSIWNVCSGSIRELYRTNSTLPTRNVFWSKGVQMGHRSRADMGCYATIYATNFSAAGVQSLRQRSQNWTEYEIIGESEIYITFLRRGLWVSDRIKVFGTTENMDPEVDFRSELIYTNLVHSGTLGAVTSAIPFATWTSLRTQVPPLSWQVLATNIVRFNSTFFSITNWTNSGTLFQYNRRGLGQPWSVSVTLQSGISDLTTYIGARAYFLESSNVIDGVTLTQWRDNVVTPATLTSFTNGSVKTDAVGDLNADGFNERYGWYEVTASGSTLTFTLPVASGRQHWPAFRVYGLTVVTVSLNGSPQTVGNGYLADNLGDGSYLVQLMDSYSSDQVVTASSIAPPGQNGNFLHFLR